MTLKQYKPTTPSNRHTLLKVFSDSKNIPLKSRTKGIHKSGGRNNRGSIAAVDINDMFQTMSSGKMTTNDNKNEDEEMDNINAQGTVGFATGEFGLGALAPGLV